MEACDPPRVLVRIVEWLKTQFRGSTPTGRRTNQHSQVSPTTLVKPQPRGGPQSLYPQTIEWVRSLPREIRPLHVVKYFPHVANKLYLTWNSPEHFERCIRDLMLDTRGGRQGFPPDVAADLATLYEYHATLAFPTAADPWDRNYQR